MQLQSRINWFGLGGAAATLVLIVVSMLVPWWQLRVGDALIAANVSPMYTNFDLMGNSFTLPALLAVNLSCILLSLVGGILMLIYSIRPTKPYAKTLLNFSFLTPLFFIVIFVIALLALTFLIQMMFSLSFPLVGAANVQLPSNTAQGVNVSVQLTAEFLWPFYLAVASAVLCFGARIYHKRILPPTSTAAPTPMATVAPAAPPTA
jgi:hypothetical protein